MLPVNVFTFHSLILFLQVSLLHSLPPWTLCTSKKFPSFFYVPSFIYPGLRFTPPPFILAHNCAALERTAFVSEVECFTFLILQVPKPQSQPPLVWFSVSLQQFITSLEKNQIKSFSEYILVLFIFAPMPSFNYVSNFKFDEERQKRGLRTQWNQPTWKGTLFWVKYKNKCCSESYIIYSAKSQLALPFWNVILQK